ncbi:MAG: filamentous hemagglutinin N-terminal domain-containing protein [Rhodocyclaceae bacterium]|nr:MAG: filamentous hemagglutinin N-terminal domain-containing protein [Rhodocyclaceae bacterium]
MDHLEKSSRHGRRSLVTALAVALLTVTQAALALPTRGDLASGAATLAGDSQSLTISPTDYRSILDWSAFGIGSGESVTFSQASFSDTVLNRFSNGAATVISGNLTANGGLILLNPNGFVFSGATIHAPFIAISTWNLSDADFLAGNPNFQSSGNSGSIQILNNSVIDTSRLSLYAGSITLNGNISLNDGPYDPVWSGTNTSACGGSAGATVSIGSNPGFSSPTLCSGQLGQISGQVSAGGDIYLIPSPGTVISPPELTVALGPTAPVLLDFVLEPVPEPTSGAYLLIGLSAVAFTLRRRKN